MRQWILSVTAAVALGLCAQVAPSQGPPEPKERWIGIGTAGLEIAGDIREKRLVEIARQLVATRLAIDELVSARDAPYTFATRIRVFADAVDLAAYRRPAQGEAAAGEVATVLDRRGRMIVFEKTRRDEVPAEVAVLLATDRTRQLLANAPEWLVVGLSGNFLGLKIHARSAVLPTGSPPRSANAWPEESQLRRAAVDPGAATEVVRRLLMPGTDHSREFLRYLRLLRAGTRAAVAWEEAFASSFAAVLEELEESAAGTADLQIDLPHFDLPSTQILSYPQVLVTLGHLLTRISPWNTVAADLHFETALELVPDLATALRGVGIVRDLDHRRLDAAAAFDLSLAADSHDPATLSLSAWGLIEGFRSSAGTPHGWEEQTPKPILEARRRCASALELDPDLAIAQHCWGATHLYDRQVPIDAVEALRRAAAGVPDGFPADLDLIAALGHQGELEAAWLELGRRLPQLEQASTANVARATLVEDAMTHAAKHVGAGNIAAARTLLERARMEVENPQLDSFLEQLDDLERKQLRDDQIHLHNQAVAHLTNGDLQQARVLIERLLEQELPADLRASSQRMLDQLP